MYHLLSRSSCSLRPHGGYSGLQVWDFSILFYFFPFFKVYNCINGTWKSPLLCPWTIHSISSSPCNIGYILILFLLFHCSPSAPKCSCPSPLCFSCNGTLHSPPSLSIPSGHFPGTSWLGVVHVHSGVQYYYQTRFRSCARTIIICFEFIVVALM